MEIVIHPESTLAEISERFRHHFPYLKLMFYENNYDHEKDEEIPGRKIFNLDKTVHDLIHGRVITTINIHGKQKVKNFEKLFKENTGMWVQVYRRSGKVWLQTTTTDDYTLREVNEIGEKMSVNVKEPREEQDYHEQQ